jgi:hypothetical protein
MKHLAINDLARNEQLDRTAMAGVRGGFNMGTFGYKPGDNYHTDSHNSSIYATQDLMQAQKVVNATANGSAFLHNIDVHNDVSQRGKNLIVG